MGAEFGAEFHDSVFNFTGLRDEYGPSPSARGIERIVKRASQCHILKYDEAAWFTVVHSRLLALALENDVWENAIDYVPWCVHY